MPVNHGPLPRTYAAPQAMNIEQCKYIHCVRAFEVNNCYTYARVAVLIFTRRPIIILNVCMQLPECCRLECKSQVDITGLQRCMCLCVLHCTIARNSRFVELTPDHNNSNLCQNDRGTNLLMIVPDRTTRYKLKRFHRMQMKLQAYYRPARQ